MVEWHHWPRPDGGRDAWRVDRLVELAEGLPVVEVDVDAIAEVDAVYWFDEEHRPTVRRVLDHVRRIEAADPGRPVILGADGRVMDGMHRIARAVLDGRATVPAVILDPIPEPDERY